MEFDNSLEAELIPSISETLQENVNTIFVWIHTKVN